MPIERLTFIDARSPALLALSKKEIKCPGDCKTLTVVVVNGAVSDELGVVIVMPPTTKFE